MSTRLKTTGIAMVLALAAGIPAAGQQSAPAQSGAAKRELISSTISGFNIVLVVGETQPSKQATAEELPAGARKALSDMREFLPYKHYRVLDMQWSSCCGTAAKTQVTGRLQGLIGVPGQNGATNLLARPYAFTVTATASMQNLPVRFVLHVDEAAGSGRAGASSDHGAGYAERQREHERQRADLKAEIETLELSIRTTQQRIEVGMMSPQDPRPMQDRHASLLRRLVDLESEGSYAGAVAARPIIDSSFTMDAGETVVVGTSRLGGDKALIALITAVRRNRGGRE